MQNHGKKAWLLGVWLLLLAGLSGCGQKTELLAWIDEVQVMLGGEPFEVRRLRKEPLEMSDGAYQEYYFRQLSTEEQRVYRQILDGVRAFDLQIAVTSPNDGELNRAYSALLKDHPELFWIHSRGTVYKTVYRTYGSFQPDYCYDREESARIQRQIDAAAADVLSVVGADATDYQKVRQVYQYVITHTAYVESDADQNIAGALGSGEAVCAGYARAVQFLLEKLGVECIYVSGDMKDSTQGHAWNLVRLDGEYYYVDATNGDQQEFAGQMNDGEILYDYLCPIPQEYAKICQPETDFSVPECTGTAYNDYARGENLFESYDWDALYAYLVQCIDEGASTVRVKFSEKEAFDAAWSEWIEQGGINAGAEYYMNRNGLGHLQYHYGALEDLYTIYFMF